MKKSTIKVKINSNGEITRVIGNVGQTRMNRAAAALWAGNIEPTRGYKLRRFIKRLVWTFNAKMDESAAIAYGTDVPAAEVPYIGLLEAFTIQLEKSDTDEVYWEHIDRVVMDELKLDFGKRDYTNHGRVVNYDD